MPALLFACVQSAWAQAQAPERYSVLASSLAPAALARPRSLARSVDDDFAHAHAALDRIFDGGSTREPADGLGAAFAVDARARGDSFHSLTVSRPRAGLSVELGKLGASRQSPETLPSWYVSAQGDRDSRARSRIDYTIKAQAGRVALRSRLFPEPADPRPSGVVGIARRLGLSDEKARALGRYVDYDDRTRTRGIIATSMLAEIGRAHRLWGPLDVSWAAGALTRTLWFAPNQSFDETVGLRLRLRDGVSVGVFGGAAQNLSPLGRRALQDALDGRALDVGLDVENAPHAALGAWGKVPGLPDARFSATSSRRWNESTSADKTEGSVLASFFNRPLAVRASLARERGAAVEFDRRTSRGEVHYSVTESASAFMAHEREDLAYGNARVDMNSFMLGLNMTLGKNSSLTYERVSGARREREAPAYRRFQQTLRDVNRGLLDGVAAADRAAAAYDGIRLDLPQSELEAKLDALSLALSRLEAAQADALLRELAGVGLSPEQLAYLRELWLRSISPDSPLYGRLREKLPTHVVVRADDAAAYWQAHRGEILELTRLLADKDIWNAALVNATRGRLIELLDKEGRFEVPIGGSNLTLKLDATTILAAANVLNSRLSPMAPPVARGALDPVLLREAGKLLGLEADSITEEMIAERVFQMAEERLRADLERRLKDAVAQAVHATAGEAAEKLLASLPAEAAAELRRRYGDDLSGLINPQMTADEIVKTLLARVPPELAAWLARRHGADVAQGLAAATSWAAELIRREINMQIIRLMLAGEELDRLTVDRGRKLDELNLRFALRSFQMLDERGRARVAPTAREPR